MASFCPDFHFWAVTGWCHASSRVPASSSSFPLWFLVAVFQCIKTGWFSWLIECEGPQLWALSGMGTTVWKSIWNLLLSGFLRIIEASSTQTELVSVVLQRGDGWLERHNNQECCGPDSDTSRMSSGEQQTEAYFIVSRGRSGQRWPDVPISKNQSVLWFPKILF